VPFSKVPESCNLDNQLKFSVKVVKPDTNYRFHISAGPQINSRMNHVIPFCHGLLNVQSQPLLHDCKATISLPRKCPTTGAPEAAIHKCHELLKAMGLGETKRQHALSDQIGHTCCWLLLPDRSNRIFLMLPVYR